MSGCSACAASHLTSTSCKCLCHIGSGITLLGSWCLSVEMDHEWWSDAHLLGPHYVHPNHCCAHTEGHLEMEILAAGECPKCVADISPHRNCVMR